MAIQSAGELDTVLQDVLLTVERLIHDEPRNAPLNAAARDLKDFQAALKKGGKPGPLLVQRFTRASEVVRQASPNDADLSDRLFDVGDFIDLMK